MHTPSKSVGRSRVTLGNVINEPKDEHRGSRDSHVNSTHSISMDPSFPLSSSYFTKMMDMNETKATDVTIMLSELGGYAGICEKLKVDMKNGLSSKELGPDCPRVRVYGNNHIIMPETRSFFAMMWDVVASDMIIQVLCIAAIVILGFGIFEDITDNTGPKIHWVEGFSTFVAIAVIVLFNAYNAFQAQKMIMRQFLESSECNVNVRRDGKVVSLSVHDIVVGDLLILKLGDVIPVDGILLDMEGRVLSDQGTVTGESKLLEKFPFKEEYVATAKEEIRKATNSLNLPGCDLCPHLLISGASVSKGTLTMIVICVGPNTRNQILLRQSQGTGDLTPFQCRLKDLAKLIGKFGASVALILFLILFVLYLVEITTKLSNISTVDKIVQFIEIIITVLTVIVVAIPEGLPMAVTIALAYAAQKMREMQNEVINQAACEAAASVTHICTDKTGTLTTNQMTVVAGMLAEKSWHENKTLQFIEKELDDDLRFRLRDSIVQNTGGHLVKPHGKMLYDGGPTEGALIKMVLNIDDETINLENERKPRKVHVFPFSSDIKTMTTIVRLSESEFKSSNFSTAKGKENPEITLSDPSDEVIEKPMPYRVYVKGASEIVLKFCSRYYKGRNISGGFEGNGESKLHQIQDIIAKYASETLRTIVVAYKDIDEKQCSAFLATAAKMTDGGTPPGLLENLTFLVVVGMKDPLKEGVIKAIDTCQMAGIAVIMVTGDNISTANAIAKECGILRYGGLSIEGSEFRHLHKEHLRLMQVYEDQRDKQSDIVIAQKGQVQSSVPSEPKTAFQKLLPKLRVIARSSPEDKQILVVNLQKLRFTVAVTGDGANDGPALAQAECGFAMGSGTDVAKHAAKIKLLDDNFSSIVNAISWGRNIAESIRKFLTFQLTVNVSAVLIAFFTSVLAYRDADGNPRGALTVVQLLWINLIMDTFAAIALATDTPEPSLLERAPVNLKVEPLINWNMRWMIGLAGAFQTIVMLCIYFLGYSSDSLLTLGLGNISLDLTTRLDILGTLTFNTFVMIQFFNLINCRRIDHQYNVFHRIFSNWKAVIILAVIFIGQIIIVQVSGPVFKVHPLSIYQWLICIGIGMFSLVVGVLVRLAFSRPTPRAEPVRVQDASAQYPGWSKLFNKIKQMKYSVLSEDEVTVTIPVSVYERLKSALENVTYIRNDTQKNKLSTKFMSRTFSKLEKSPDQSGSGPKSPLLGMATPQL